MGNLLLKAGVKQRDPSVAYYRGSVERGTWRRLALSPGCREKSNVSHTAPVDPPHLHLRLYIRFLERPNSKHPCDYLLMCLLS
ncbi:Hypothetical protein NTJ_09793 [Nesidiocoris tenuis]|uniref:Uncharacterized protein n=1 Tax=Nesidiocoris tenuis TaxID=355587 RepID=A0ABN7AXR7_9HEMI|nr:Hypothetical protein NTJ_09793 [Nesidiocoris tenuis]